MTMMLLQWLFEIFHKPVQKNDADVNRLVEQSDNLVRNTYDNLDSYRRELEFYRIQAEARRRAGVAKVRPK